MSPMSESDLRAWLAKVEGPPAEDQIPAAIAQGHAIRRNRRTLTAVATGVVAVAVATFAVGILPLLGRGPDNVANPVPTEPTVAVPSGVPSVTPSTSGEPSVAPTPTTGTAQPTVSTVSQAVYFVTEGPAGPRLVREARTVRADTPARSSVEAMLAGPLDPDYHSLWPEDTRVLGISHDANAALITIDLSREALAANVGSSYEALMQAQLVWTLTEAFAADESVQVWVDGAPVDSLAGHVDWSQPVSRADFGEETLNALWIDTPAQGAVIERSPIEIRGFAIAFEAHVPYRVYAGDGTLVSEDYVLAAEGQTRSAFVIKLDLPPGTYTVEVLQDDPSDGAAGPTDDDTRTFAVGTPPLPDGRQFGFITGLDHGVVAFDAADMLTGAEASAAAEEDGAELPGDFYIRNTDAASLYLPAAGGMTTALIENAAFETTRSLTVAELAGLYAGADTSWWYGTTIGEPWPAWVTVADGRVVRVEQQYLP